MNQTLDHIPPEILCASDYEGLAHHFIEPATLSYIEGGSENDKTLQANRKAFDRWSIMPKIFSDLRHANTKVNLLGMPLQHPLLLAPVAFQELAHPQGELPAAMAAEATDTPMILSTLSNQKLETITQQCSGNFWFQLYFQAQRKDTLDLITRAQQAGYRAIVVTMDAIVQTPAYKAHRNGFVMPQSMDTPNIEGYSTHQSQSNHKSRIFQTVLQQTPGTEDIAWLLKQTELPVIVKGIINPQDALILKELGVHGIVVSNHGGRSLDGVPASLIALPEIRQAVGDEFPVLMDSGIRSGKDIFKSIALGANAVLIGRLQIYALAVAGALGVGHMIRLLKEELEISMAMCGCENVTEITKDNLVKNEV